MKRFIRLTMPLVFVGVSSMLTFGQSSGDPAPNGALPQNDPGNQYDVTRAVQWGKGTGMSRLTNPVPSNAYRSKATEETEENGIARSTVRADDYPPPNATGFANELIFVQNPGDGAFRK